MNIRAFSTYLFTGYLISLSSYVAAAPLNLSNAPLTVSSVVEPNVMLLMDTSGSMNNVIYDDNFFTADRTNQPVWRMYYRNNSGSYSWIDIDSTEGNYFLKNIDVQNCGSGGRYFLNPATSSGKCLILPDPVGGGDTRYTGEYLNYLANQFNSGDLRNVIPNQTRMSTAISVANNVLSNTTGMRFGISRFNGPNWDPARWGEGAIIDRACGSSLADIQASLATYTASTNTPLAEALYEVTRYFRGMTSWYRSGVNHTSPIQYRCQQNFTIAITDGFPTYDSNFDTNDRDIPPGRSLPDWDGRSPATTQAQFPNFPHFSDGFGNTASEGGTLYLDDIAKFAWDIDFKTSGNDLAGVSYNDPSFPKQNMYTYTVGFATQNAMLQDAAQGDGDDNELTGLSRYGHGTYNTASNAAQLTAVLQNALADIASKSGSSSSIAASVGRLQAGSRIYQARFDSSDWSGQLLAYDIETDKTKPDYGKVKTDGSGPQGSALDFGSQIPGWSARRIITNKAGVGVPFRWNQFSAAERGTFFNSDQAMLQYLRGRNTSDATRDVSIYRTRTTNLGDIVHSTPQYVGAPNFRYTDTFEAKKYSDFVAANKARPGMVYVGANDGMLHAFDAQTGVEKLAYIPSILLGDLQNLTSPNYSHRYYVNATPTIIDAFDASEQKWKTVLVGGLNGGGQAIYALDVTDPTSFSEANAASVFMWEFTDSNDVDLGFTFSQPKVVKLPDGKWYVIFGNGYNNTTPDGQVSTTGDAVLYIVDLWTGNLVKKISTNVGLNEDPYSDQTPNGLHTVTPIDFNRDGIAETIYGGDLFGNVWKFDVSATTSASWKLDYRLYQACSGVSCSASNIQPITSELRVGFSKTGEGVMVYFGTGKYLEVSDNNGAAGGVQSFYGIWDKGAPVANRSKLLRQQILNEVSVTFTNKNGTPNDPTDDFTETAPLRMTSNNSASANDEGWYIDLLPPNAARGERVISSPVIRSGRVFFVTSIPADDPCVPSGESWLMTINALDGARLGSTFDIDNSQDFGTGDKVFTDGGSPTAVSGVKVGSGASPSIIAGDNGDIVLTTGLPDPSDPDSGGKPGSDGVDGGDREGRQSWRRIIR